MHACMHVPTTPRAQGFQEDDRSSEVCSRGSKVYAIFEDSGPKNRSLGDQQPNVFGT